jgi:hypothetical protein
VSTYDHPSVPVQQGLMGLGPELVCCCCCVLLVQRVFVFPSGERGSPREGAIDPLFHIARAPLPANSVQSPELRLVGVSVRDGGCLSDGIHINSLIGVEGSGH